MKKSFLQSATLLLFLLLHVTSFSQIFSWAKKISGDPQTRILYQQVTDNNGNIYSTGIFEGSVDFDPGPGTFILTTPITKGDIFITKYSPAGDFIWAKQLGTTTGIEVGSSVVFDPRGFITVCGTFTTGTDFDPGAGTATLTSFGQHDCFLARYTLDGNYVWAKQMGGPGEEVGGALKTDTHNNIIFFSSMNTYQYDCDPGAGVNNVATHGDIDLLVCKFDQDANFIWGKVFGGVNIDHAAALQTDNLDNILIGGQFQGTADYDPGPGVAMISSVSSSDFDAYLLKLTPAGDFSWIKVFRNENGPGVDARGYSSAVTTDPDGNIYHSGYFLGTIDLDPGPGVLNYTTLGDDDFYVSKYSPAGNLLWAKVVGGSLNVYSRKMVYSRENKLYVLGSFNGTADFDPGPGDASITTAGGYDIFITSFDPSGNYINTKRIGGPQYEYLTNGITSAQGDLIIGGDFAGTTDFDPGPGTATLTSSVAYPNVDLFIVKFASPNVITGTTFKDLNSDGIRQSGEAYLPKVLLRATGTGGTYFGYTDAGGNYRIETDTGSYTINPAAPLYYSSYIPAAGHTAAFGSLTGQTDINNHFGLIPVGVVKDLNISLTQLGPARRGFATKYHITINNKGTDTVNANISFTHDNNMQFITAIPAPATYGAPVFTWNISNLEPEGTREYSIDFLVKQTAPLLSVLKSYATVNPVTGDFYQPDNSDTVYHIVSGSFDPNDKKVIPSGPVTTTYIGGGGYLNYTVRFQNTGNDTAFQVVIRDTLSTYLDINTLELISASHPYTLNVKKPGVLEWNFSNIQLPDSNVNEAASHGFVEYRIKARPALAAGTNIKNKAGIYFDFNEPVITNETQTLIVKPGTNTVTDNDLPVVVYPNPAGSLLTVNLPGNFACALYDVSGKRVIYSEKNTDEVTLDVSRLSKAIYFLYITAGEKDKTIKITVFR